MALKEEVPLKPLTVASSSVGRTVLGTELLALTEAPEMALNAVSGKSGR